MLKQEELEKIERYINGLSDDNEKSFVESLSTERESTMICIVCLKKSGI